MNVNHQVDKDVQWNQKALRKLSRRSFSGLKSRAPFVIEQEFVVPCATSTNFSSAPGDWFLSG